MESKTKPKHPLQAATDRARIAFWYSLILSAGLNMLALTSSIFMIQLFDRILPGQHQESLLLLTIIAVIAYVAWGGLDWARNQIMARAAAWAERQLADGTIVAGLRMTLAGHPVGGQGIRDLALVRQLLGGRALFAFLDIPWALIFFAVLFLFNVWLGVFAAISAAIIASLAVLGELSSRKLQKRDADRVEEVRRWVDQAVTQAEAIQALGMRSNLLARHRAKMEEAHGHSQSTAARVELFASAARSARQVAQVGIVALAAWLLFQGSLSPGLIIAASIVLGRALAPVDVLVSSWPQTVAGFAAYSRLQNLLEAADTSDEERTEPSPPKAEIKAINVHRRLSSAASGFLLADINISLSGGEALGIMGPSGSGKTSLCRALTGITAPSLGEIRLDGARLDHWPPDALGSHLGYLPQDIGLPPATVAETIARLSLWPDMDKVYKAARDADAHTLISGLPQGYDTPIGAGGVPLSGGQRQRIGLARALFGDPVMLVLDEPDAHLDTEGGRALVRTIEAAKARGAIVVLVSHRSAILEAVDTIAVLNAGRIAQMGPRDEILAKLTGKNDVQPPKITWSPFNGNLK